MAPRKKAEKVQKAVSPPVKEESPEPKKDESPVRKVKIKAQLDESTREQLKLRAERLKKQPRFLRNEWFRYKRLEKVWRRPRGQTNKLRENYGYRPAKVRIGYGKPASVRGLHPSGFKEVPVFRVQDLEGVDPKVSAVRIGSTVGTKKRREIVESADKMGIRVLNRGVL
jgi:large subunit ribosomal protein L32e